MLGGDVLNNALTANHTTLVALRLFGNGPHEMFARTQPPQNSMSILQHHQGRTVALEIRIGPETRTNSPIGIVVYVIWDADCI